MLDGLKNISKIPELQKRILYTFLLLIVYRIGAHVPTPGIDTVALAAFFAQAKGSLLGLFDMFAGRTEEDELGHSLALEQQVAVGLPAGFIAPPQLEETNDTFSASPAPPPPPPPPVPTVPDIQMIYPSWGL